MYSYNEFLMNILNDINTINTIELTVHTSCYWVLDLLYVSTLPTKSDKRNNLRFHKALHSIGCGESRSYNVFNRDFEDVHLSH